ncbi:hypothetical protein ABZW18_21140 [Streptomyces sp. NPDC004647]|uniref:hypothetical protein n=1 Tax=Streptomyces sp. NPDC004647 TaxID=3154671 RepID=UPI0033A0CD6C
MADNVLEVLTRRGVSGEVQLTERPPLVGLRLKKSGQFRIPGEDRPSQYAGTATGARRTSVPWVRAASKRVCTTITICATALGSIPRRRPAALLIFSA